MRTQLAAPAGFLSKDSGGLSHDDGRGMLRGLRRRVLPHWTDHWPAIAAAAQKGTILNLGAGQTPLPGAVTVDINPRTSPDVVCDLNTVP